VAVEPDLPLFRLQVVLQLGAMPLAALQERVLSFLSVLQSVVLLWWMVANVIS
jgi:hypothetical protein